MAPPPPAVRLYGSPVLDAMMDENLSQENSTGNAEDFLRVGDEVIGQLIKTIEESNVRDLRTGMQAPVVAMKMMVPLIHQNLEKSNGFSANLQHVKNGEKFLPILT